MEELQGIHFYELKKQRTSKPTKGFLWRSFNRNKKVAEEFEQKVRRIKQTAKLVNEKL